MLEFILVIQMCYAMQGVCNIPLTSDIKYKTYQTCALEGYKKAGEMTSELGADLVNKNQILFKFWCTEQKDDEEKKINT